MAQAFLATRMGAVVFTTDSALQCLVPPEGFCRECRLCHERFEPLRLPLSPDGAAGVISTGQPGEETCEAGLGFVGVPLYGGGHLLGYVFAGAVRDVRLFEARLFSLGRQRGERPRDIARRFSLELKVPPDFWGRLRDEAALSAATISSVVRDRVTLSAGIRAVINVPLVAGERRFGVLQVGLRRTADVDAGLRTCLEGIARLLAGLLHTLDLIEATRRSRVSVADSVLCALAFRRQDLADHSRRVTVLSWAVAQAAGLPQDATEDAFLAGALHDVGFLSLPDEALALYAVRGEAHDVKEALARRHAEVGAEIVARTGIGERLAPLVRHHHEWLDGSGFPGRLRGEEIPLGARVVAIADGLDEALHLSEDYRRDGQPSFRDAIQRLVKEAGRRFDPALVSAFLRRLGDHGFVEWLRTITTAGLDLAGLADWMARNGNPPCPGSGPRGLETATTPPQGDRLPRLPEVGAGEAEAVARRILARIRRTRVTVGGEALQLTASIGIALFPQHGTQPHELLSRADVAMYQAKERGRNQVCLYAAKGDPHDEMRSRLAWTTRIHSALAEGRLVLYLQPILDLRQDRVTQYEVLLRMRARDGTLVPPAAFLDVAEQFGLVRESDRWVVRQAIRLIAEQRQAGRDLRLQVNLSGKAFSDPELLRLVREELAATGIDPSLLIFEITETAAMASVEAAKTFIGALRSLGCRFGLDDFGVGFSSLNYLKQLPVDYLKIDGSFVRNLPCSETDRHLVRAIAQVAQGLGKETVAEFVEDEETLRLLKESGIQYAQGYHIGRPRPAQEALASAGATGSAGERAAASG